MPTPLCILVSLKFSSNRNLQATPSGVVFLLEGIMPLIRAVRTLASALDWLFLYAVRTIAVINSVFLIIISSAFLVSVIKGSPNFYDLKVYAHFKYFGTWGWVGMIFIAFLQFASVVCTSQRGYKAASMMLFLSSLFWGVVSATAISTKTVMEYSAPYMYGVWAIMVCLAGVKMLLLSRQLEDKNDGGK